jgi:hypothetical protein
MIQQVFREDGLNLGETPENEIQNEVVFIESIPDNYLYNKEDHDLDGWDFDECLEDKKRFRFFN